MSTTTGTSPPASGFHAFDHGEFADWPEYVGLARAIDAFAQRCERDGVELTQADFEQPTTTIARHLIASDCCETCIREHGQALVTWPPIANLAVDGTLAGVYRCEHGHAWRCGWANRESVAVLT